MEPNYSSLDPEERINKFLAFMSALLGVLSLCGGLIPLLGIVLGLLGLAAGNFGRKSESRRLALAGIIISAFGLLLAFVYAVFLFISRQ
jgi:hypothetical protein